MDADVLLRDDDLLPDVEKKENGRKPRHLIKYSAHHTKFETPTGTG
jgi:hypothetical protein